MFDREKEEYFLVIPKQRISKGSVSYAQKDLREQYPSSRYLEVISAHSHNTMNAYFSSIDDRDEQGDLIYMVMGKLHEDQPTFSIRANVAGKQCCFLGLNDIFDFDTTQWNDLASTWRNIHPAEWMNQLNVEADYHSAHFDSSSRPSSHNRSWPIGFKRNKGRVHVYGAHGSQQSFDFDDFITSRPDDSWGSMAHIFSEATTLLRTGAEETKLLVDLINTLIDNGHKTKLFTALKFSNLENLYQFEVDDEDLLDPISILPDFEFEES